MNNDFVEVKKTTKCMFCGKELKKGTLADYSHGRGYTCQSCYKRINGQIESLFGNIPDIPCPLCKGKGKVSGCWGMLEQK